MKKYALITTYYCTNCSRPSIDYVKSKLNYDGDIEDLYVNFSDEFDPWNKEHLNVGISGRKDLVYGKIFLLKNFIRDNILGKYEYITHVDYSDTRFVRSFKEMMSEFENSKQDFIISTEKNCWPDLNIVKQWVDEETYLKDKEFYYVNSGAIISKTEILYNYLDILTDLCLKTLVDFWDDQGVWQYYNLKVNKLNSDTTCKYFFSTGLLDDSYYQIEKNLIKTKFQTFPYLIHDNSSFSLNLINRIQL
jgi:hypothetical protein